MKNFLIAALFLPVAMFGQIKAPKLDSLTARKIDSLTQIDFITYPYKSVDIKNKKILLSSEDFDKTVTKFSFYKERIKNYNDSLSIALMHEFGDPAAARIANLQINYNWKRISYYLWMPEEAAQQIALSYGITHPYYFKKRLENEQLYDEKLTQIMNDLKQKVYNQTKDESVLKISKSNDLLKISFEKNPQRLADFKNSVKNHDK